MWCLPFPWWLSKYAWTSLLCTCSGKSSDITGKVLCPIWKCQIENQWLQYIYPKIVVDELMRIKNKIIHFTKKRSEFQIYDLFIHFYFGYLWMQLYIDTILSNIGSSFFFFTLSFVVSHILYFCLSPRISPLG